MAQNKDQKDQPVSLEDLLRLKRNEQPDSAFWARFDRELHEKTLRSIVKKDRTPKSIWAMLSQLHPALPIAGAAAFALTLAVSNNLLTFPVSQPTAEVASLPVTTVAAVEAPAIEKPAIAEAPVGSPSYVVSALPSREAFSDSSYTQVPASRALSPAHRPDVQFIGGTLAAAVPYVGQTAGIY